MFCILVQFVNYIKKCTRDIEKTQNTLKKSVIWDTSFKKVDLKG